MISAPNKAGRESLKRARRCVVKIGSAVLTKSGKGLDRDAVTGWAEQIARLKQRSIECVVVTSGAVAAGMQRLGRTQRPHALHELQAMAAVGQMSLVGLYEAAFQGFGIHAAQVLLIHDDFSDRRRYLNARSTLRTLLDSGVIPVVNENDTVATEEIRFDQVGHERRQRVEADFLLIVTDRTGLFDRDPQVHADAVFVSDGVAGDPKLLAMAGGTGSLGRGGMRTKLLAAEKAARSGAATVIAGASEPDLIARVLAGESVGTYLRPAQNRVAARKQWLAGHLQVAGRLVLDAGAVNALVTANKSLLPIGVKAVQGDFERGEIVSCVDPGGREIARGLVNYSADEARRIVGHASDRIESILGYIDEPELIGRDNMVLM